MNEIVQDAQHFATQAHKRIDQRRKYTNQPYEAHLKAVADIVKSVTDDPEMIAAAWMHDTLEDTPATYEDIETRFGRQLADLVCELTDISRPSDGNRAVRKAIDRRHLAQASNRAKTIKLADLIDNCSDIVKHDPKFAKVFVTEVSVLIEVLEGGDPQLMNRVRKLVSKSAEKLNLGSLGTTGLTMDEDFEPFLQDPVVFKHRVVRLFSEYFRATDIAEPLRSFDSSRDPRDIARVLKDNDLPVAGIRIDGMVMGYARREDLEGGSGEGRLRNFSSEQIVEGDASLSDVVFILTRYDHCFITLLGEVVGFISRAQIQNPVVRMWLFGMVTLTEIEITEQVLMRWPDDQWKTFVSKGRLENAKKMQEERKRRGLPSGLLDCLQFSDKAQILIQDPEALAGLGFKTKGAANLAQAVHHNAPHRHSSAQRWRVAARVSPF